MTKVMSNAGESLKDNEIHPNTQKLMFPLNLLGCDVILDAVNREHR